MNPPLGDVEIRVLGALFEKARTTPDSYPLSLNAVTTACNQTSNRDPVMSLAETEVSAALDALRKRQLVRAIVRSGAAVTKYAHLMDEALGLVNRQLAVLTVLMLRGPQTAGELRTRAQRLHDFDDVADVESALDGLADAAASPGTARGAVGTPARRRGGGTCRGGARLRRCARHARHGTAAVRRSRGTPRVRDR